LPAIPNISWRIGAHAVAAQGDTNLDVSEAGAEIGNARPGPASWGELSTGSVIQAIIDELYWPCGEDGAPATVEDDSYNFPICYVFTQTPQIEVVIGQRGVSQVTSAVLAANQLGYRTPCTYEVNIREMTTEFQIGATPTAATFAAAPGSSLDNIAPGSTIQLEASRLMDQSVGKETIKIATAFSYTRNGQRVDIPGHQATRHTIYRVAATPQAPQATPWVCVLDKAVEWAEGADSVASARVPLSAAERPPHQPAAAAG